MEEMFPLFYVRIWAVWCCILFEASVLGVGCARGRRQEWGGPRTVVSTRVTWRGADSSSSKETALRLHACVVRCSLPRTRLKACSLLWQEGQTLSLTLSSAVRTPGPGISGPGAQGAEPLPTGYWASGLSSLISPSSPAPLSRPPWSSRDICALSGAQDSGSYLPGGCLCKHEKSRAASNPSQECG